MDESYHSALADGIEKYYRQLQMDIEEDVVRRLAKAGKITSTADWQIQRYQIIGGFQSDIDAMIKKATDENYNAIDEIITKAVEDGYTAFRDYYEKTGKEFIPFEDNAVLSQMTAAIRSQISTDFDGISHSLGFALELQRQTCIYASFGGLQRLY